MAASHKNKASRSRVPRTKEDSENCLVLQPEEKERQISPLISIKPGKDHHLTKLDQERDHFKKASFKYEKRIQTLETAHKKLRLEKDDLHHRYEQLLGQHCFATEEINNLQEMNKQLTKNLDQALARVEKYHEETTELKRKLNSTAILEQEIDRLTQKKNLLITENEQCMVNMEKVKDMCTDEKLRSKQLEKSVENGEKAITKMKLKMESKDAEIKQLEDDKDQLNLTLEKHQKTMLKCKEKLSSMEKLKKKLKEKEKENIKKRKSYDDERLHLQTELKEREHTIQAKMREQAAIEGEKCLLSKNLFHANEEIKKLKTKNRILNTKVEHYSTVTETRVSEFEEASLEIGSLQKQLNESNEQVEELRKSKELVKLEAEKQNGSQKRHITRLQGEKEQLQKTCDASRNEIFNLRKQNSLLESSLTTSKSKCIESQQEVNSLKLELSKQGKNHKIMLNKVIQEAQHFHRPKRCFKKKRDPHLWTNAMSGVIQQIRFSGGKKPVKILHQPCAGMIEKLNRENNELQQMLNRRPDSLCLQLYWCKKNLQKALDKVKVLEVDHSLYINLSQKEQEEKNMWKQEASKQKEEKNMWMQKFQKIGSVVQTSTHPTTSNKEMPPVTNHRTAFVNLHGKPTKVTVANLPANRLPIPPQTPKYSNTSLRLPAISRKSSGSDISAKCVLPAIIQAKR